MKQWAILVLVFGLVSTAQAQEPVQGSVSRQERERDHGELRRGSGDARQLDRLLRMRQRSQERAQRLRQPAQASQPANAQNSNKNVVKTQ